MIGHALALASLLAVMPLQPHYASWTITPPPPPPPLAPPDYEPWRLDWVHARLSAPQAVTPRVTVLYWRGPQYGWVHYRAPIREPFAAGQERVLSREVPFDVPGPVIFVAWYDCPDGRQHSVVGAIPRPGEELPPGVTQCAEMHTGPICEPLNTLFRDGFESGGLTRWAGWRSGR